VRGPALASLVVLAGSLIGTLSGGLGAQSQSDAGAPTGLLMGVVVDAQDDRPVPHAEVTLGGAPPTVRNTRTLTDAEGRFVFLDLPRGTYTLSATMAGYVDGALGRRRPAGPSQPITLGEAERVGDLRIPMWKFAAITGRVVDEAGEPLVGIAVQVLPRSVVAGKQKFTPGATATTDDRGIYRIATLTPGEYAVAVPSTHTTAPLAVMDLYRQRGLTPMKPGESDFNREVSFSGASNALYQLERYTGVTVGTTAFISSGGGMRASMSPLPSGDGRIHVYPTRYYSSASTAAEAMVVTVQSGEERLGVDLQLMLVGSSRVSGIVTGPEGPMVAALSLVPDSEDLSTDTSLEIATTISDAAGRFTFLGVPEGRHRLRAVWLQVPVGGAGSRGAVPPTPPQGREAPAPPRPALGGFTLWATETLAVGDTDIRDLAITLSPGFRVGGRAEFVGGSDKPSPDALRRMSATFDPADARPLVSATIARGQFDEQGYLSSYQLPPGRYYVRINNAPPGWTLRSAVLNGRDISNVPVLLDRDVSNLAVIFTDRPSSIAGQVHDASGAPDPSATVLVFPADSGAWIDYGSAPRRLRAVRVGRDGHYQTTGLPPGEYLVVAVADEATANWQDPAVLKALARVATRIDLPEGESRSQLLRTSVVSR